MISSVSKYGVKRTQLLALCLFLFIGTVGELLLKNDYTKQNSLIPYSASTIDKENRNVSPFGLQNIPTLRYRHWLGTDHIGRDVLAGIISGARVAVQIGFLTVILSILIGLLFGYLGGYVGDKGFKLSKLDLCISLVVILLGIFYLIYGKGLIRFAAILSIVTILIYAWNKSDKNIINGVYLPFDLLIMRVLEIFKSIPGIFLILVLLTMFRKPSVTNVVLVIVIVRWPSIARYLRAEILKIKEQDYIMADRAMGIPEWRIFKNTVLPLAISPVLIISAFGFASAILLESTLSFLGIGVPPDVITWGSLLNMARHDLSSWWLAFFPGLMIYLVIFLFNSLGDSLDGHLRGRTQI